MPDTMHPIEHIRKVILGVNQADFAAIAGVNQATVSRWEKGELEPRREDLAKIRHAARERGLIWDDSWFFEPPGFHVKQAEPDTAA